MLASLPDGFGAFVEAGADRFAVLKERLEDYGLAPRGVELAGNRHLVVAPHPGASRSPAPRTVLAAHYDRTEGSPGANDNGAAVFALAAAARRLDATGVQGWLAVFTDREEAATEEGPRGQGAYALALAFKAIGLADADFFIFDACGRGDTLVVSTAVDLLLEDGSCPGAVKALREKRDLRARALEAARRVHAKRVVLAPTPFSDDAGFLAAGLAAQTLTVLPQEEASALLRTTRSRPECARALVDREVRDALDAKLLDSFFPRTWSLMHGAGDSPASLTPTALDMMERLAVALAEGD